MYWLNSFLFSNILQKCYIIFDSQRAFDKHITAGLSLEGDLGEKVSLNLLTSPYFELREKFIEHGEVQNMVQNFSLKPSPFPRALG